MAASSGGRVGRVTNSDNNYEMWCFISLPCMRPSHLIPDPSSHTVHGAANSFFYQDHHRYECSIMHQASCWPHPHQHPGSAGTMTSGMSWPGGHAGPAWAGPPHLSERCPRQECMNTGDSTHFSVALLVNEV